MESESQKIRELGDEVLKKIGKNILLYQEVEKGLKILLPFISSSEKKSYSIIEKQIKKQTLGGLISLLLGSFDYSINYKPLQSPEE
jgi:hypothetical protein